MEGCLSCFPGYGQTVPCWGMAATHGLTVCPRRAIRMRGNDLKIGPVSGRRRHESVATTWLESVLTTRRGSGASRAILVNGRCVSGPIGHEPCACVPIRRACGVVRRTVRIPHAIRGWRYDSLARGREDGRVFPSGSPFRDRNEPSPIVSLWPRGPVRNTLSSSYSRVVPWLTPQHANPRGIVQRLLTCWYVIVLSLFLSRVGSCYVRLYDWARYPT